MSKIKGRDKLFRQFDLLQGIDFTGALMEGGEVLKDESQKRAPFKTGFLRRSHKLSLMDIRNAVKLVVRAPYAAHVEFGTWKMSAQPYLRPAIDTKQIAINRVVGKAAQEKIKDSV